ncbi:uncharacterized protein [Bemisia tabaci]|uniref:uncharacterized protein n=1 Tax=Bemisia tabaci TaxID=7038 RepID=UPI003B27EE78
MVFDLHVDTRFEPSNILMPIYSLAVLVVLALAVTVSFHRFNYPCSKLSECILWVLSWYHVIHSMFLVVIATYHRRRLTALALTKGAALATGPGAPFVRPFVYFAVVFLARSAVVHASRVRGPESAAVVALYCLAVSVPVVLEALVVMFFSVAENAFQSLHEEAESLLVSRVQEKAIEKRDLERLAEAHWSACDYVDTVNATFGLDMIVCMTFNMARFVVFVYLAFVNLYALKLAFLHTLESGVALVLELLDVTFRVFYTCYKATKIQTPVRTRLAKVSCRPIIKMHRHSYRQRRQKGCGGILLVEAGGCNGQRR